MRHHKNMGDQSLRSRVLETKLLEWKQFHFIQQQNFKSLSPEASAKLKNSILANDFTQPFYVWHDTATDRIFCLDGFHRVQALKELEAEGTRVPQFLPATLIYCESMKEASRLVLIYSSIYAKITEQGLYDFMQLYELSADEMELQMDLPELDMVEFQGLFNGSEDTTEVVARSLQERFIIPPFSIFDTRQGYWQERKKKWHQLFDSQESRQDVELIAKSGQAPAVYELRNDMRKKLGREPEWDEILAYAKKKGLHIYEGASIFDPVLCEVLYTWFCPEGAWILDPFAGGSVRGIVAGMLGHNYLGIDLRADQVAANEAQWSKIIWSGAAKGHGVVNWKQGDSNEYLRTQEGVFDFIFSCPPYHDLEQYSDDPADLSNMKYDDFLDVYWSIIRQSIHKLKDNRFACFVVGDIRDENGFYRDFVSDTISAFAGQAVDGQFLHLYNEIILVNVAGSLPVRIGRQFEGYRKVGKMHQNVLVFYKGDPKKIKEEFPEIKLAEALEATEYQPNIALSVID